MAKYLFAYHGGPRSLSPEEGRAHMDKWMAWMSGLGDAVVDRGLPVGKSMTVGANGVTEGGGPNPLSGFTIVGADATWRPRWTWPSAARTSISVGRSRSPPL